MKDIPYGRQSITEEDIAAVTKALRADFLTQGPAIQEFEEKFARYVGAPHAVAVANGTAALHLAAIALGVKPGQKVITTPITFSADANCVLYCGGEIAFADIDPETYLLDPRAVRKLLESQPRGTFSGIIPVDFAGLPVDLAAFRELADEFGLWLLEDACHAPGAAFTDRSGGRHLCGDSSLAELAIFSFHPVKHIACGEGGMITTRSAELDAHLRRLRTHGITKNPAEYRENHGPWYHELQELGFNYRLTDFQAALGTSQLKRADAGLARRREIAQRYDQAFRGTKVKAPFVPKGSEHAYHLYVIQVEDRRRVFEGLKARNIFAQVHYIPVHYMPLYRDKGFHKGSLRKAEAYYEKCISLPMYPTLTDAEQSYVIEQVLDLVK